MKNLQSLQKIESLGLKQLDKIYQSSSPLLKAKHGNVSEIAYQVGMQPGYFTKTFKKLYGIKPKELI